MRGYLPLEFTRYHFAVFYAVLESDGLDTRPCNHYPIFRSGEEDPQPFSGLAIR